MNGIFVAFELIGRNPKLLLPTLAFDTRPLGTTSPGLEGSNAERLPSAIGCQRQRDMSEQDLRGVGVGGLTAPESSALAIIAVGERRRIVNDQIVPTCFAA